MLVQFSRRTTVVFVAESIATGDSLQIYCPVCSIGSPTDPEHYPACVHLKSRHSRLSAFLSMICPPYIARYHCFHDPSFCVNIERSGLFTSAPFLWHLSLPIYLIILFTAFQGWKTSWCFRKHQNIENVKNIMILLIFSRKWKFRISYNNKFNDAVLMIISYRPFVPLNLIFRRNIDR